MLLALGAPAAVRAECENLLPTATPPLAKLRPIEAGDLARLRDIGQPDGSILGRPSPLALSPDAKRMAFVLTRGDPDANRHCRALVVMDIRPGAQPRIVDRGGAFTKATGAYRGLVATVGYPELVVPRWRPDGRALAYLRREGGITQVWMAQADGSAARQITRSDVDVEAFAWTATGERIVFVSRPGRITELRSARHEARGGFLYDARIVPNAGATPRPSATVPRRFSTLMLATGEVTETTDIERALLDPEVEEGAASARRTSADGRHTGMEAGSSPLAPARLWAEDRSGARRTCAAVSCAGGITGLWWQPNGSAVLFLRREGWAMGDIALYRWAPGSPSPQRIMSSPDALDGCVLADAHLLCTRESASAPRRLVRVDVRTGRSTTLLDPNPEFAHLRLGTVERLLWRNDLGLEVRGDLVLPPDYRPGTRLPLIVTQYFSNGFLRGGTGDEYPIHAFAVRGFAVLSLERPAFYAAAFPELQTYEEINAANARGWSERKSLFSALSAGIDLLVERGIADPKRIGLTGLSDGATSAVFALIARHFAAASISTCCIGPWTTMSIGGIAYADRMRGLGYPAASENDARFWQPVSLAANAARIDTPILMQLADDEYLLALESFTALREQGKPVEMFVFPEEHHIKWQPAHRLAIYQRNLAWFDFWLRGVETGDPDQIARWRGLRVLRDASEAAQDRALSQASTSTSRMMRR